MLTQPLYVSLGSPPLPDGDIGKVTARYNQPFSVYPVVLSCIPFSTAIIYDYVRYMVEFTVVPER